MAEETTNTEDIRNTVVDLERRRILEIDDEDYTIDDHDDYDLFVFTSLSKNRTLTFPTLSKHKGKEFGVMNLDGSFDVDCTPAGTDKINTYTSIVPITEKGGRWDFRGATGQWLGRTDGRATMVYVGTETTDTLTTTLDTWYDVSLGASVIIPTKGTWIIDSFSSYNITIATTGYIYHRFGIGTTAADVLPDLIYQYYKGINVSGNLLDAIIVDRVVNNREVEITSDNQEIFLKSEYTSNKTCSAHSAYGISGCPMFIKARRIR